MLILDSYKQFKCEEDCENYLKSKHEKEGIACRHCRFEKHYWSEKGKKWICRKCGHQTTLTAGTVMHSCNMPLMSWFQVIHFMTMTKGQISAAEVQRQLGHKRYQPIWEMVHKLRTVMGLRDDKHQLTGAIELDE